MNQKSGNNKYDIVSEAEAVLDAYAQRCKIYARKAENRQQGRSKKVFWIFFGFGVLFALIYWGIYF